MPQTGSPVADSVQALADEVAAWMGVGGVVTQVGGGRPHAARRGGRRHAATHSPACAHAAARDRTTPQGSKALPASVVVERSSTQGAA